MQIIWGKDQWFYRLSDSDLQSCCQVGWSSLEIRLLKITVVINCKENSIAIGVIQDLSHLTQTHDCHEIFHDDRIRWIISNDLDFKDKSWLWIYISGLIESLLIETWVLLNHVKIHIPFFIYKNKIRSLTCEVKIKW